MAYQRADIQGTIFLLLWDSFSKAQIKIETVRHKLQKLKWQTANAAGRHRLEIVGWALLSIESAHASTLSACLPTEGDVAPSTLSTFLSQEQSEASGTDDE